MFSEWTELRCNVKKHKGLLSSLIYKTTENQAMSGVLSPDFIQNEIKVSAGIPFIPRLGAQLLKHRRMKSNDFSKSSRTDYYSSH